MGKKVSVILPVYNGEANIAEAIDSVLAQTYTNFELIIVNDCSTDGTLAIIEDYVSRDERVRVLKNPMNLKLPRSLNVGFADAKGDYWTWTSDDNMYKKNAIEVMVEYLENHPDVDMVYTDYNRIDADGNDLGITYLGEPNDILTGNTIGACFLYTRNIASKVGEYDTNLFLAEDYDYWIRIYCRGNVSHLKQALYYYRQHSGSLTATRKEQIGIQTYKALEKNFLMVASQAKNQRERYAFYDQMLWRLRNNISKCEEVRKSLYSIDRDYERFTLRNRVKAKMKRMITRR